MITRTKQPVYGNSGKTAEEEIIELSKNTNKMKLVATKDCDEITSGNGTIQFNFVGFRFEKKKYLIKLLSHGNEVNILLLNATGESLPSYTSNFMLEGLIECYGYTEDTNWFYIEKVDHAEFEPERKGSYKVYIYELEANFTEVKDTIAVPSEVNKIFCQQFVADSLVVNDVQAGLYEVKLSQTSGDNITYSMFMFDFKYETTYGSIVTPYVYDATNARIIALKGEYSQNSSTLTFTLIDTQGNPINSPTDFHVDIYKVG